MATPPNTAKVAAHFDKYLTMPRQVNQQDTWKQELMVAIPKQAGADDFDEYRYFSLLATMSKSIVRILVERMRKQPRPRVANRFHTIGYTRGWQTSAVSGTIREAFWKGEHGHSTMLWPQGQSESHRGATRTSTAETAGQWIRERTSSSHCGRGLDARI